MKAAQYTQYGPPEVVQVIDIPTPSPMDNEVLIRVHASTVNRTDCGFRSAEYFISRFWSGLLRPKQQTLGCEFAGEVADVGSAVKLYKVGDRVFGFNDKTFGGHAEYLVQPEDAPMAVMPAHMTYEEAAPLTEGAHYALVDIRAVGVTAGQNVLVYGGTGAIGSAAVQILKSMDVRVTAVCGGKHVELVRSLGADEVVDYQTQDFTRTEQRFDFVFDAVGKTSFGTCKPILKPKGIYISTELGKNGQNIWYALIGKLSSGKKVMFPIPTISKEDVEYFKGLAEAGNYRPVIDRKYSLKDIVAAYRFVESGQKVGNVVVTFE